MIFLNMLEDERRKNRIDLIKQIEKKRQSRVIAYILGDRPNLATNIDDVQVRLFQRHLEGIGSTEEIDIFIYSRGGDVVTPYRIATLIREFSKKFGVLVPYRSHSAATLLCLGADEIIMGSMGELTPIDPRTVNPFNPQDPMNPQQRIPISVEDVTSYFSLAKEKAGIKGEENTTGVLKALTSIVHPLALGNVQRIHLGIRLFAKKLLSLHMDPEKDAYEIDAIIKTLTEELYAHAYPIGRKEAKEVGLKVKKPDNELEETMWSLYKEYETLLKMRDAFDPHWMLGDEQEIEEVFWGACIESREMLDVLDTNCKIRGVSASPQPSAPPRPDIGVHVHKEWKTIK